MKNEIKHNAKQYIKNIETEEKRNILKQFYILNIKINRLKFMFTLKTITIIICSMAVCSNFIYSDL